MTAPGKLPFAAVLLAGGQSRRMGRDKALLPLPDGRFLWERQLEILRDLEPAELFISGFARPGFPEDARLLPDAQPGLGPMAGIVAALAAMQSPLLVVLAVDLPAMTRGFLRTLVAGSDRTTGLVPKHAQTEGYFEPLAATYPAACREITQALLDAGQLSLQGFIQAAGSVLRSHRITAEEAGLFVNWNEPAPS